MSDMRPMDERDDLQIRAKAGQKRIRRALRDSGVEPGGEEIASAVAEILGEIADSTPEELQDLLGDDDDEPDYDCPIHGKLGGPDCPRC